VRDLADAIQLLDRDDVFVRRDLKDAVGRRVDDRKTGAHVLGAELVDDDRAGRRVVAERPASDAPLELGDDVCWKAVWKRWERVIEDDPRDLPVTGDRVLSRRPLGHASERAKGRIDPWHALDSRDARQAERTERRELQPDRARDVADRVAAAIAILVRVGQLADAHAVENGQNDSIRKDTKGHWRRIRRSFTASSSVSGRSPAA